MPPMPAFRQGFHLPRAWVLLPREAFAFRADGVVGPIDKGEKFPRHPQPRLGFAWCKQLPVSPSHALFNSIRSHLVSAQIK